MGHRQAWGPYEKARQVGGLGMRAERHHAPPPDLFNLNPPEWGKGGRQVHYRPGCVRKHPAETAQFQRH